MVAVLAVAVLAWLSSAPAARPAGPSPLYDIVIRGSRIVDGLVNGNPVIDSGVVTGKMPARAFKGPGFRLP